MGNIMKHQGYISVYYDAERMYYPGEDVEGFVRLRTPKKCSAVKSLTAYLRGVEIHNFSRHAHPTCCQDVVPTAQALLSLPNMQEKRLLRIVDNEYSSDTMIKSTIANQVESLPLEPLKEVQEELGESNFIIPFTVQLPENLPPSVTAKWNDAMDTNAKFTISFIVYFAYAKKKFSEYDFYHVMNEEMHSIMCGDNNSLHRVVCSKKQRELHFKGRAGMVAWRECPITIGSRCAVPRLLEIRDEPATVKPLFFACDSDVCKTALVTRRSYECNDKNIGNGMVRASLKPSYMVIGKSCLLSLEVKKNQQLKCEDIKRVVCQLVQKKIHTHFNKTTEHELVTSHAITVQQLGGDHMAFADIGDFLRANFSLVLPYSAEITPTPLQKFNFVRIVHELEMTLIFEKPGTEKKSFFSSVFTKPEEIAWRIRYPIVLFTAEQTIVLGKSMTESMLCCPSFRDVLFIF